MTQNQHHPATPVSPEQWDELAAVESIAESFGIADASDAGQALAQIAYGAYFRFAPSTMPGYRGDLFLLVGDAIDEPLSVVRKGDGTLQHL